MDIWFVKDTDFSQHLSQEELQRFLQVCPTKQFDKGDTIFHVGEPALSLHIIVEGQVKLATATASGNERILAICAPQDFIGEAFLANVDSYQVEAVALTKTITCPVSREQFKRLMNEVPGAVLVFTEVLAGHLFHCYQQLSGAYDPVRTRVIKALLEQAQRFGTPAEAGWVALKTELRHDDIAALVTATRVSVSMTIADLRERGLLNGTRGNYTLHLPALASLAEV